MNCVVLFPSTAHSVFTTSPLHRIQWGRCGGLESLRARPCVPSLTQHSVSHLWRVTSEWKLGNHTVTISGFTHLIVRGEFLFPPNKYSITQASQNVKCLLLSPPIIILLCLPDCLAEILYSLSLCFLSLQSFLQRWFSIVASLLQFYE